MIRQLKTATFLAFREQRADLRTTLCYAIAFASVLAPILTLLALKEGVVDNMTRELLSNPATLEVIPVGAGRYDLSFFNALAATPGAALVLPRTRSISARLVGLRSRDTRKLVRGPALIPTADADPVTDQPAPNFDRREVILSAEAARELEVRVGAMLTGWVERQIDGKLEKAEIDLTVIGIAPAQNYGRVAVFAPLDLLIGVENFIDGVGDVGSDEEWLTSALQEKRSVFASFRVYAKSIYDVLALRDAAEALGAAVRARSDRVVTVLRIDAALTWLFAAIAGVASLGFIFSLSASLRANVERLRPTLSMLRLLGAGPATRWMLPFAQSALIVALGAIAGFIGFGMIAALIDWRSADLLDGASVLLLTPETIAGVLIALVIAAALSAIVAAREALRVGADEILRKV